jgi:hypothetical protein
MNLLSKLILSSVLLLSSFFVNATLIGDTVTVDHLFPNQNNSVGSSSAVVLTGTSDTMTPFFYYSVNVEANSILINNTIPNWNKHESFNGVLIDSLNDSSGNDLIGVIVETDMSNWNDARLSFDKDSIWINFGLGTSITPGYINLLLDFGNTNSIPEPSSFLLLSLGLIGLGFSRKQKSGDLIKPRLN